MKRFTLQTKLVGGGLILVLIPLLAIGFFSVFSASKAMDEQEKGELVNLRKAVVDQIDTMLGGQTDLLKNASNNDSVMREIAKVFSETGVADLAHFKLETRTTVFHDKDVYGFFFITDEKGTIIGDTSGGVYRGTSVAGEDFFEKALKGETVIGQVLKMEESGPDCVVTATPLNWKEEGAIGVIVSGWRLDFIAKKIGELKLGKTGYAFLAEKNGRIIVHPDKEVVLKGRIDMIEGMEFVGKQMNSMARDIAVCHLKGEETIVAFGPVRSAQWSVGFVIPRSEVMAPVERMRNVILIAVFCIIGLATLLIFWTVRRTVTKPISHIVGELDEGAGQVFMASAQVSYASQSLADAAASQASSLEETASSLEEMASVTRENADSASQVNHLMKGANDTVSSAGESMGELTVAMEEISEASKETSKIIKTIDEIAFQTNLLALNAAVEAARAGEAGAGFAVVADEVRNLAMRAAEAAQNTSQLIEDTVKRISQGSEIVNKSSEEFTQVAKGANKVGKLVGEIAAASHDQAQGIEMLNKTVADMDKMVQQNASGAEESAGAAEEMNKQAEQMKGIVGALMRLVGEGGKSASGDKTLFAPGPGAKTAKKTKRTMHMSLQDKALKQPNASDGFMEVSPETILHGKEEEFSDF